MKRAIVTPAQPPPSALAELKSWLGITTARDDAGLTVLLRAALETCEGFTGIVPLALTCEEVLPAMSDWQTLVTRPVRAITGVASLTATGDRTALMPGDFALDLDADGAGMVRMLAPLVVTATTARVVVSFSAGLAADWDTLPETLRHGIIRLAAHQYREREGSGASSLPPASVAALWRPWRRLRLA